VAKCRVWRSKQTIARKTPNRQSPGTLSGDNTGTGRANRRGFAMGVEWQGDHRLLGDDVKQDFERELTRLGLDPSKFLVEVRREPDLRGADGLHTIRYNVYITDLAHPDRDTWKLHGGHGENWIAQFAQIRRR
jgi:hypothetical protein